MNKLENIFIRGSWT